MTQRTFAVISFVCLMLAPVEATPMTTPVTDESAIRAVLDTQVVAWNKGDLDGYMKGYWSSPELSFFGGATRTNGYTETLARYSHKYKEEGRAMGTLSFGEVAIEVLSPDAAIVRGEWKLVLPDGKKPHGLFTLVVKRKSDGWRIVHDHSSGE